ncbi:Daunorubicin/doxorubicin resistance ATP-binding protein DrrA [Pirellulimonas nuda]|uniref:Daunorubicin/doxorubicin resistance ATP-binding protein DrrA n=1 Tax=Pirellulimonas nuda TaxID=2528009 RepID=A0A518DJH2_9BACT|nr:ABC transporter ATP-binding protein [Pirellulimonas nuda]QDU91629.1 Daunorubicin/doxorubicin resistance ATP-binding protein DrrA [Pirellulimonas nuda]
MRAALEVTGVAKKFGGAQALCDVSFGVRPAERLALLGPNGAGKTTLIRCICGRVRPDSGYVSLMGRRLGPRSDRSELGFVPQELAVYPDLTTSENLWAFGRFHGLRGTALRQRVAWALEWTGLADRAAALVKTFSGGMKRRVNIACGVLHRPRVLLLDEPTVGVDPQSRERIFNMLDSLHAEGTSIVLTTHQLEEAQDRCDRIVIIDHGRLAAEGTLAELIDRTVGRARAVQVKIDGSASRLAGMHWDNLWYDPADATLRGRVVDIAAELPPLLARIGAAGGRVEDVTVAAPTLHTVFLHLTGRELRE